MQPTRELKTLKLSEIKPYPNNPRKNDNAVETVTESIKQCGYCAPIAVDEAYIILAGHTRLKAIKKLGWKEAEVLVISGLTDAQKKKYRLLDNKTGEIALWDFDALNIELEDMDFEGFDFDFNILDANDYGTDFSLPSGAKESLVQMTFTLANEQAELVKTSIQAAKGDIMETFGNANENGNALYEVVRQWAEQRR